MTAILDSIRRIVAEDAAHAGTTHELYLRRETVAAITGQHGGVRTIEDVPVRTMARDSTRRDCIATIRRGQVISVTNL